MGGGPTERVALMSIHLRWADAIMSGEKRVEFRKRRLAADIQTVLVYATAPVSKVIGQFRVDDVVSDTPEAIWAQFGSLGVIGRDDFFAYYEGSSAAIAIVVANARRFEDPLALADIEPRPAVPQSFAYLSAQIPALLAAQ